ncbi:MAG: short-chain fatty acid transporter [Cytophagales bacterium]|uniref:short-chain fatty acid transporter n=1 Tax=Cyclobacterium marinum TaxID=104 RepID=UPI0030DA6DED|nr:short-chain fatty acid transporter [Cytophagales bacterium]|tara:strand:+ start:1673 stop:3064 length:1392 start_codon:yes stop_codon:yes gene_type:complete
MVTELGERLTRQFRKYMPDAFVFALALTIITSIVAMIWAKSSALETIQAWYAGFWMLLEFGMQMVLILVSGYCIALSPFIKKIIYKLTNFIQSPKQVYPFVMFIGLMLSMISWGWMVITAALARELALRIKGINYPYLIACVYFSGGIWVSGLSSSIPLLLNTENNYLIEAGILSDTISTSYTLGSILNLSILTFSLALAPILFRLLIPHNELDLEKMLLTEDQFKEPTIKDEAKNMKLPYRAVSDRLNNSSIFPYTIGLMGLTYIIFHFSSNGLDLNLNIMIFIFVILGMFLHKTPVRYGIAMRHSSANISGILFQFPFYAGIMGIMIHTGLGKELAQWMSANATIDTYPLMAFLSGGFVNFAIPSAGGEFAVIGPSIINAIKEIGAGLPETELNNMIARAALSVAYGETLTNLLQPFYLLIILPVMGIGIKIQARDVMGYLLIPFLIFFIGWAIMVTFVPI